MASYRRIFYGQLITLLIFVASASAFDVGFDYRAAFDSGFCTDPTPYAYWSPVSAYPTNVTINGFTFNAGWSDANPNGSSESASGDCRLAGIVYLAPGFQSNFEVDLPSTGSYNISLANGDLGTSQGTQNVKIFDNTTMLADLTRLSGFTSGHFYDAAGTLWTTAQWPGSQQTICLTFSSTTFKMQVGSSSDSTYTTIANLRITSTSSCAGPSSTVRHRIIQ